ncbi:LIM zinc-binding domain-containing protein [Meloidogyne graminicola]|uniref:LIM zinc-binding domain-containing protein n=1 Tax=Meloidogyne graminicola TaxID=189291 RepID=A0A8T0A4W8_9BILA|nr:LIM zinc-binding domain-containing protein [Meloidogyne graminicola]
MSKDSCYRCNKPVYPTDKIGPLKDGTFFHQGCFKCYLCGSRLALKTYCNNRESIEDREVYCRNHVPIAKPHDPTLPPPLPSPADHFIGNNGMHNNGNEHRQRQLDAGLQDLKIAHAMKVTQVRKPYPKINHGGAKYIVDYDAQTRLELLHRQREDKLYEDFQAKRETAMQKFEEEEKEEWERALLEFTKRKYENGNIQNKNDLIRELTIKKEKKRETINSKLKERERLLTIEMVEQQSKEMLDLYRQSVNQQREDRQYRQQQQQFNYENDETTSSCSSTGAPSSYPTTPPPPMPPSCSKRHIYTDTSVFTQIDQLAVCVASQEMQTFTDLVRSLTAGARSDVDKARAIYRWITVKNLNVMTFDSNLDKDTPMGLLRGIKYGIESYHVLFKRLCSYAGLHCVVIKGFSKSAGYQPGIPFPDNRFRNTWNAVFLDGSWRFVQCNWGARHLVNAKELKNGGVNIEDKNEIEGDANLRYEYDDHYYMTDPEEMIYEFFPDDSQWQLLPRPITLKQFEQLPFVRSLFFRFGLQFTDPRLQAVLKADRSGAVGISLSMGPESAKNLIFHYYLRFFENSDKNSETLKDGSNLKRYVMQSMNTNNDSVIFRVHVPTSEPLLLDIFANSVSAEHYLTGQPVKFKSVCKFKIICEHLIHKMVPLPECASGEWGPFKATRLFGLIPLTHEDPIINCGQYCDIRFRMMRPLNEFVASLHKNGVESKRLQRCVQCNTICDNELLISLEFPDEGQYGLELYTRDSNQKILNGKQLFTHCCKYLINARVH